MKSKLNLQHNNRKNIALICCNLCENTNKLERHRIIVGGPYSNDNVIVLCKACHSKVHWLLRQTKRLNSIKALQIVEIYRKQGSPKNYSWIDAVIKAL